MSDIQLSDEDRQRLVHSRFGELFAEHSNDPTFVDALAKKVAEILKAESQTTPPPGQPGQPGAPPSRSPSNGKVSAFDKFILGR